MLQRRIDPGRRFLRQAQDMLHRRGLGRTCPERVPRQTVDGTNMTRGWSPHGQPLVDKVPHGHWSTLTFRRRSGATGSAHRSFSMVPPPGRASPPGSSSSCCHPSRPATFPPSRGRAHLGQSRLMGNPGSHNARRCAQLIRSAGARRLFLPAPPQPFQRCAASRNLRLLRPTHLSRPFPAFHVLRARNLGGLGRDAPAQSRRAHSGQLEADSARSSAPSRTAATLQLGWMRPGSAGGDQRDRVGRPNSGPV